MLEIRWSENEVISRLKYHNNKSKDQIYKIKSLSHSNLYIKKW